MVERLASRIVAGAAGDIYEWKITHRRALDGPALRTTDGVWFGKKMLTRRMSV
jgi:hypothetical protein